MRVAPGSRGSLAHEPSILHSAAVFAHRIGLGALIAALASVGCQCGPPASPAPAPPPPAPAPEPAPAPTQVDPPAGAGAFAPRLLVSGASVLATWLEKLDEEDPPLHRIRFARLRDGEWSDPVTVVESREVWANWADFPSLARATDGTLLVSWARRTGEATYAYEVHLSRSRDGGRSFSSIGPLHDDGTPTEHGFVSLLPEADGFRAFWLDGRLTATGGAMTLRTARVVEDAVRDSVVIDPRVCDCCQTGAAVTPSGPVVVYRDRSDGEPETRDIAMLRRIDDSFTAASAPVADGWQITGCPVNGPVVAADGARLATAWFTGGEPTAVRIALSSDAGATLGEPVEVSGANAIGRVDVVLTASGEAVVSWLERTDEERAAVSLRRVAPDGTMGAAHVVATTSAGRASGFPRLARIGDELLVAWVEPEPESRIRARTLPVSALPAPRAARAGALAPSSSLEVGAPLPPLTALDLEGRSRTVTSTGRPLVVSFWATWCEPCREELDVLARLHASQDPAAEVVAVSVDDRPTSEVAAFVERERLDLPVLHDASDRAGARFGVPPLPATFVFDAAGRLAFARRGAGPAFEGELRAALGRLDAR